MHDRSELSKLAAALGGLPVLGCRDGSPAQQAGVRYGDILLSVNGIPTPDWSAFLEARSADPSRMVVEVFRDGITLVLGLPLSEERLDPPQLLAELIADQVVPLALPLGSKPSVVTLPN